MALEGKIVGRGLIAGALAGLVAFGYARLFLEPIIGRAVGYEAGRTAAEAALGGIHARDGEVFSRGVQSWAGMGFGVLAFSIAMGGLFAVAFVIAFSRCPGLSARRMSLLLAAGAFTTVNLVPSLKYPASPPAVGEADTIGERTELYLLMVVLSVAVFLGALWAGRQLAVRLGPWCSVVAAGGGYVAAVTLLMALMPAVSEIPRPLTDASGAMKYPGFPAEDLYHFRLDALGAQVIIWTTIGLVFGALASRLLQSQRCEQISA